MSNDIRTMINKVKLLNESISLDGKELSMEETLKHLELELADLYAELENPTRPELAIRHNINHVNKSINYYKIKIQISRLIEQQMNVRNINDYNKLEKEIKKLRVKLDQYL